MPDIKEKLTELDIDSLQPNPLQPRGSIPPESLVDLADSIREHGILEPLVVAHTPAGYQIIAGERRWRAAKIAGLTKVPAHIKEVNPREMLMLAIIENVQREDLTPFEEAAGYKRLAEEFGLTHVEIGRRVGKARETISNIIRLLGLPDMIKDAVLTEQISTSHAYILLRVPDSQMAAQIYTKKLLQEKLSVAELEEFVRRLLDEGKIWKRPGRPQTWKTDRKTKEMEKTLKESLSCQVELRRSTRVIRLYLRFHDEDEFNNAYKRLTG